MDVFLDARASLVTKCGRGLLKKGIYWQQFFSSTLLQDPPAQCVLLSVPIILFGFKCVGVNVLDFYSCLVNLLLLKDSSSDCLSSSWSAVTSCPWLLCFILLSRWGPAPCRTSKMQHQILPYAAFPQLVFQI